MLEHVTDTFCYEHATPVKCVFDGLVTIKEYYKLVEYDRPGENSPE